MKKTLLDKLYEIGMYISIVIGILFVLLLFVVTLLGLFTSPVHASEPLNVTNVHYTADNGLQTGNTFTLREGYRERIYYQIEYTGDGNPADLMLMWNDYQGIEITVQQYTQGSGVMLVRYNESFSGWGVTSFWVQGGNGNGKRMLRFRSQPNTPPVTTPETTEQPTQTEVEENTNVLQQQGESGLLGESEQQQQSEQPTNDGTSEQPSDNEINITQQPTAYGVTDNQSVRNDTTTDSERGQTTSVSMEEKTQEKTVESKEKPQEAVSDVLAEKKEESTYTASKHGERKPDPKKNTKDNKGKVLTAVVVWGIILGSSVIAITERLGKKK